jgi:uncharacterized membrane protein HdeD (DUF308 family)
MSGRNSIVRDRPALFTESGAIGRVLARNWWAIALRGVFAILFGMIAFMVPGITISALIFWFAIYMLIDGALAIVAGFRAADRHERWGLMIFEGITDLLAGVISLAWPMLTLLVFLWIAGGWAILSGIVMLIAAFRLNITHGRWLLALGGTASTVWGLVLLMAPITVAVVVTWWLGTYALIFGVVLVALAIKLRSRHRESSSDAVGHP